MRLYRIYTYMRGMFAILMSPMRNRPVPVLVAISNADIVVVLQSQLLLVLCCITLHTSQCRLSQFLLSLTRLEL